MASDSIIVIPVYKELPNQYEHISLLQCAKIFDKRNICLITHQNVNLSFYLDCFSGKGIIPQIEYFDENYFTSIHGYNHLLLSTQFYSRFLEFKYMLIYQLDSFVFSDQLDYWCMKNYDYIGAPWLVEERYYSILRKPIIILKKRIQKCIRKISGKPLVWDDLYNLVGNGGFSLRNVRVFCKKLKRLKSSSRINEFLEPISSLYNEDVFWSYGVDDCFIKLRRPSYKKALFFSFENHLSYSLKLTKGKLPFGCHAWERYDISFWRPIFKDYGYNI